MLKQVSIFFLTQFLTVLITVIPCFCIDTNSSTSKNYKNVKILNMDTGEIDPMEETNIDPADVMIPTITLQNLDDIDISLIQPVNSEKSLKAFDITTGKVVSLREQNIDPNNIILAKIQVQNLNNIDLSLLKSLNDSLYELQEMYEKNYQATEFGKSAESGFGEDLNALNIDPLKGIDIDPAVIED